MKTALDPRHKKRKKIVKKLFSYSFQKKEIDSDLKPIIDNLKKIDALITDCAPEWPVKKLNKIDLAILRLAIYELISKKNPKKVIIDEAIELAKEYGSQNSAKFINGVLGAVLTKNESRKTVN